MASFKEATYDKIFGHRKYLKPGDDDDKLLALLEIDSDIEYCECEEDDDDTPNFDHQNVNTEDQAEIDEGNDIDDDENNVPMEILEAENEDQSEDESDDNLPLSVYLKNTIADNNLNSSKKRQKSHDPKYTWEKSEIFIGLQFEIPANENSSYERRDFTPSDYFSQYLHEATFQEICDCTNVKYMLLHNRPLNLTLKETKHFFGISVLMSLLKFPRIRMYWTKSTRVYAIATVMTRDRYFRIRNHLKVVVDNDISENVRKEDKLWKVRPLLTKIKETCLTLPRENIVAVDEQMIPFTGICAVKQFVRGKPNPEGLKNFVCATPAGLVLDFEVYQGKNTFLENSAKHLGVGPSAVVRLVQSLRRGSQIFMDRYFTTLPLLEFLLDNQFHGTGTIMKSRIPRSVHLTSESVLKRLGRGATDQSVRSDGKINIIQWYDLKPVLLASTKLEEHPIGDCKRWSKTDKKFIRVKRPDVVTQYNESMGGIDLIDRMIAYYRINARTNKWTIKTIFHFTDLAIANSWILYREDRKKLGDKNMQFFDFKLKVSQWLLGAEDNEGIIEHEVLRPFRTRNNPLGYSISNASPHASSPPIPNNNNASIRNRQHLPILRGDLKNAVRCKYSKCNKKTKFMCEKCNEFYCITYSHNCFYVYHIK